MALVVPRIAPALLASAAMTLLMVSARAETADTPAAADCLAKPSGPSARGSHWYYRVQHPSGRHCWYQRPVDAAADAPKDAPAHPHTAAATTAPPPPSPSPLASAAPPVSDTYAPAAAPTVDNGDSVVPPIAAPVAPLETATAAPYGVFGGGVMPVAPPAAAPSVPAQPVDTAAQAPVQPQVETPPPPDVAVPQPAPVHSVSVARRDEYADPASHVPALFGAVSALMIIILGSFVGRFLSNRRERRAHAPPRAYGRAAVSPLPESPALVPAMAAAAVRETAAPESTMSPDDWGLRRARQQRRVATPAAPVREATRVLEANVRELLGRLQNELRGAPSKRTAPARAEAPVPTQRELDAVLAIWRAKRGGRA